MFCQVFHRFDAQSVAQSIDDRFDFFIKKIIPQYKDAVMNHVLIYIPSYFDYVRLRNYFRREGLNFVQICEYSKVRSIMCQYCNIKTAVFQTSCCVVRVHFFCAEDGGTSLLQNIGNYPPNYMVSRARGTQAFKIRRCENPQKKSHRWWL